MTMPPPPPPGSDAPGPYPDPTAYPPAPDPGASACPASPAAAPVPESPYQQAPYQQAPSAPGAQYPGPAASGYPGPYGSGTAPTQMAADPHRGMALGGTIAGGIGILFACCCTPVGLVLGVVGAVLGHMALSAMKSSGVTTSKELATAAVAAGWTAVGLNVVMAILGVILNLGSAFGGLDTIGS